MNKHLTDEQIQLYLDPSPVEFDKAQEIRTHLESCKRCQNAIRHYKVLYEQIAKPIPMTLPKDFKTTLLDKVAYEMKRQKFKNFLLYGVFYGAGIAAGLGLGISYIDYDAIKSIITNESLLNSFALVFDSFQNISLGIDIPWGLMATVVTVVVLLYILDHYVLQQFKHSSLFK